MKDYEVFRKWLDDVLDVVYGPSHNWPFKALEKEGMLMGKIKQKPKRNDMWQFFSIICFRWRRKE